MDGGGVGQGRPKEGDRVEDAGTVTRRVPYPVRWGPVAVIAEDPAKGRGRASPVLRHLRGPWNAIHKAAATAAWATAKEVPLWVDMKGTIGSSFNAQEAAQTPAPGAEI